jgi:hypothetical protein
MSQLLACLTTASFKSYMSTAETNLGVENFTTEVLRSFAQSYITLLAPLARRVTRTRLFRGNVRTLAKMKSRTSYFRIYDSFAGGNKLYGVVASWNHATRNLVRALCTVLHFLQSVGVHRWRFVNAW